MKKRTLDEMIDIANKKHGQCLSDKYINDRTKLKWRCDLGHIWNAIPSNVIRGSWCPICSRGKKTSKYSLGYAKDLAKQRGGKCLSYTYNGYKNPLVWQCNLGHTWKASLGSVIGSKNRFGTWCKQCNNSYGESYIRFALEIIFKTKFPTKYPEWLIYKGNKLELDGYSETLKIAFEYQGCQHYEANKWYGLSSFAAGKLRDRYKQKQCKKFGVKLIIIPEIGTYLKFSDVIKYLRTEFAKLDIQKDVPENLHDKIAHLVYLGKDRINSYRNYCKMVEIEVLDKSWFGFHNYYLHKCMKCNHEWRFKAANIYIGKMGCPICNKRGRKNLFHLLKIAKLHDGELVSDRYLGMKAQYLWRCKLKHEWKSTPKCAEKLWCPICNGRAFSKLGRVAERSYNIESINLFIGKERKGVCLSQRYKNARTKLKWQCHKGHQWKQTLDLILAGKWCPHCAGNAKLTMENMDQLAKNMGGKCLSKKYVNNTTKLKWRCNSGHVWTASPSAVKQGRWCQICRLDKKRRSNKKSE